MVNDVTIGIPLYRAEQYIAETLKSALAQTYPNIDFLVIDDCSDDRSMDIVLDIQQHHPRGKDIRIIHHERNQGIGHTRNHLIDEAKTKYFFFLDADDTITENAIQLLHNQAEQYQAEIVYGSHELIEWINDTRKILPTIYDYRIFYYNEEYPNYVFGHYKAIQAPIWNAIINLNWFRNTGLRFLPINYWEDFSLTMDLSTYVSKAILLPTVTYYYNRHNGSLTNIEYIKGLSKETILNTIGAIDYVKQNSDRIKHKTYFPGRMVKVMMTDFYIVCNILKNKDKIQPSFSKRELRDIMKSPLNFWETISLKNRKFENLFLYLLGVLPQSISIGIITILGKHKGLI
jgi:glycosyltransferase involved in cell wall biosynthesis